MPAPNAEVAPATGSHRPALEAVWAALGNVRDPELDEPITDLRFVVDLNVSDDGDVEVALRLPTFFCAPNFAYLMAADARDEVSQVAGVRSVRVRLVDHFVDEEVSTGVSEDAGFDRTFAGFADGDDLEELRSTFTRKAYLARTHDVVRALRCDGVDEAALLTLRLRDLPDTPDTGRFLARRKELGLPIDADAPLLLDVWGSEVPETELADHLRRARTVHVSIEGNAGFCRGLLETRYAPGGTGDDDGRVHGPAGIDPEMVLARAHELLAAGSPLP